MAGKFICAFGMGVARALIFPPWRGLGQGSSPVPRYGSFWLALNLPLPYTDPNPRGTENFVPIRSIWFQSGIFWRTCILKDNILLDYEIEIPIA